jgi:ubiquinone/menaquinone biosynthesis C-methylase UbiE
MSTDPIPLFDANAKGYEAKYMDVSLYHAALDRFCALLARPNAEVLELACGPGNITKYVLKQRPDLRILGTDLAPNMLELARMNCPTATFQLLDQRRMSGLERAFDGIISGFGLPYLTSEEAARSIRDAARCLNPNGVLYLSTMEDDPAKSGFETSSSGAQLYINYHRAQDLGAALNANGFNIADVSRVTYSGPSGKTITDVMIVATLA